MEGESSLIDLAVNVCANINLKTFEFGDGVEEMCARLGMKKRKDELTPKDVLARTMAQICAISEMCDEKSKEMLYMFVRDELEYGDIDWRKLPEGEMDDEWGF